MSISFVFNVRLPNLYYMQHFPSVENTAIFQLTVAGHEVFRFIVGPVHAQLSRPEGKFVKGAAHLGKVPVKTFNEVLPKVSLSEYFAFYLQKLFPLPELCVLGISMAPDHDYGRFRNVVLPPAWILQIG